MMEENPTTELAELWVAARSYRPESARQRRSIIGGFAAFTGDVPPADLTATIVLRWWSSTEHLAPASRRAYHSTVKQFLAWCRSVGIDAPSVMEEIRRPTVPRSIPKVLSPDEELRLRAHVSGGPLETAVLLMLDMGFRRAEVSRAKGEDINGEWMLVRGKGGHVDTVPVADTVAACAPSAGRLAPWVPDHLAAKIVAEMKAAGIRGRSSHALRRTFATRLMHSGVPAVDVMHLLRHRSLGTTTGYVVSSFDRAA